MLDTINVSAAKRTANTAPNYRALYWLLVFILFAKLWGFFTVSESVALTRIFKILVRVSMTGLLVAIGGYLRSRGMVLSIRLRNPISPILYGVYLYYGFVSMLWSTDVGYSMLQWFMIVEGFTFAVLFLQIQVTLEHYLPDSNFTVAKMFAEAITAIILIFLIGMWVNPDSFYRLTHGGDVARLGGYFMNPNELGMLGSVGIACCCTQFFEKSHSKAYLITLILICLYGIVETQSRSTLIGLGIALFYFAKTSGNKKILGVMILGAFLVAPIAFEKIFLKQGNLDEVLTMTGRLPFWQALLTEGLAKEPLTGFGFMRIYYTDYFESAHTYAAKMAHNTFVQVLMNLGFLGFTTVVLQIGFTIYSFFKVTEIRLKIMFVGMFIPIFINSLTEFGIFGDANYGIMFYQFLIFSLSIKFSEQFSNFDTFRAKKNATKKSSIMSQIGK